MRARPLRRRARNIAGLPTLLVLAAAGLLGGCSSSPPADDGPSLDAAWLQQEREEWFGVYLDGVKTGWSHTTSGPFEEDGRKLWLRQSELAMELQGAGGRIEIHTRQADAFEIEPPYRLLRYRSIERRNGVLTEVLAMRDGDDLLIETRRDGEAPVGTVVHAPRHGLRDALAEMIWLNTAPEVGERIETRILDTTDARLRPSISTLTARREGIVAGVLVRWVTVERRIDGSGDPEIVRVDENGDTLSWSLGAYELRRETAERARQQGAAADIVVLGNVPVDAPLGIASPTEAFGDRRWSLRATGAGAGRLADGPGQRVVQEPGGVLLELDASLASPPATADEVAAARAPTPLLPANDPEFVLMAREALRAAGDPADNRARVEALAGFVAARLEDSYLEADHPTVARIVAVGKGDCSDHTLLFATLARAVGLAARPVAGLLYLGDETRAFGPHEWCEVALDGHWVPVDPTFATVGVHPGYVRLGTDPGVLVAPRLEFAVLDR